MAVAPQPDNGYDMGDFGSDNSDADDDQDQEGEVVTCKECNKSFYGGSKGVSVLNELCLECNVKERGSLREMFNEMPEPKGDSKKEDEQGPTDDVVEETFQCDFKGCSKDYYSPCDECRDCFCEAHHTDHNCDTFTEVIEDQNYALPPRTITTPAGTSSSSSSNSSSSSSSSNPKRGDEKNDGDDDSKEINEKNDEDAMKVQEDVEFNSRAFLEEFFTDDTTHTLNVGGIQQLFTQKKYHHGPHLCYWDLEIRSKLPNMLNYYLLSAVAMKKEHKAFYAMCWVESPHKKTRYILLAVLRSKCLQIRYEFVLCDVEDNNNVFILCGVTKIMPYIFYPDIPIDHEVYIPILSRYICDPQNKLALIPGTADKDEYGNFIAGGFDPIADGLAGDNSRKRRRTATKKFAPVVVGSSKKKRKQGKKETTTKAKKGSNAKSVSSANVNVL
jgi:hypothetical protein